MPRPAPRSPSLLYALVCVALLDLLAAAGAAQVRPSSGRIQPGPSAAQERVELTQLELGLRQGQTERALRSLARALKRTPTPLLLLRYAELTLPLTPRPGGADQARVRKAAELVLEVLARPDFRAEELAHQLSFHAAWARALLGAHADALAQLEQVAGLDPGRGLPYLRALAALALAGDPAICERALTTARSIAPGDPVLLAELGLFWLAQGQAQRALPLLAERYAREPGLLSARRDYAYALSAVGRPGEAVALLGVAREACRAASVCGLELARFALEARDYPAALAEVSALRTRAPRELSPLFLEADVHLAQGDAARARAAYKQVLEISPENLRARAALVGLGETPN
ncbi:MAG TPA: tetratricopeptide repeat protein [Polyangiales bacterium]